MIRYILETNNFIVISKKLLKISLKNKMININLQNGHLLNEGKRFNFIARYIKNSQIIKLQVRWKGFNKI
jgi:hypothetical protein